MVVRYIARRLFLAKNQDGIGLLPLNFFCRCQFKQVRKGEPVNHVIDVEVNKDQAFTDLSRVAQPFLTLAGKVVNRIVIYGGKDPFPLVGLGVHQHWRLQHDLVNEGYVGQGFVTLWCRPLVVANQQGSVSPGVNLTVNVVNKALELFFDDPVVADH